MDHKQIAELAYGVVDLGFELAQEAEYRKDDHVKNFLASLEGAVAELKGLVYGSRSAQEARG